MIPDPLPPYLATAIVIGLVFAALTSLAGFAYLCIAIWDKLKRRPSLDESLKDLVTKPDLTQMEGRLRGDIDEVDKRCTEEIRRMRSYNSKTTGEMFELMRAQNDKFELSIKDFSNGTNRELNALSKEVGKLAGLIEARNKF